MGTYATVDGNGKIGIATGTSTESQNAMTATNGYGNTHGFFVNEQQATISNETASSGMTLNDNGATFSNSDTGRPTQVHGIADGRAGFDAVNVRQLNDVKLGVAGVAGMTNIPSLPNNKQFNLGLGIGAFQEQTAIALGGNMRIRENFVAKASVGTGLTDNGSNVNPTIWGVGATLSW